MRYVWGERRGSYRLLVGKPVGKRRHGRLGLDSIIIFKCILKYGVCWIYLAGDREQ